MLDKNENKSDDMVEIMSHLLKYTPVVEYNEDVQVEGDTNVVERASVYPILFVARSCFRCQGQHKDLQMPNSTYGIPCVEALAYHDEHADEHRNNELVHNFDPDYYILFR